MSWPWRNWASTTCGSGSTTWDSRLWQLAQPAHGRRRHGQPNEEHAHRLRLPGPEPLAPSQAGRRCGYPRSPHGRADRDRLRPWPWPRDTVPYHPNADPRDEPKSRQLMRENIEFWSRPGPRMSSPTRVRTGPSPARRPVEHPLRPARPRATENGIITKLSVFPKPYQKPHPQLWGTVSSPNSLKQTAELGFNAVTWRPSVLQIREWCETYASIRSEREGREFALGEGWAVQRNTYVADSMEEAKDDAEEAFSGPTGSSAVSTPTLPSPSAST